MNETPVQNRIQQLQKELKQLQDQEINKLLKEREAIDLRLAEYGYKTTSKRKTSTRTCKICGEPGHNSRGCPQKKAE